MGSRLKSLANFHNVCVGELLNAIEGENLKRCNLTPLKLDTKEQLVTFQGKRLCNKDMLTTMKFPDFSGLLQSIHFKVNNDARPPLYAPQ